MQEVPFGNDHGASSSSHARRSEMPASVPVKEAHGIATTALGLKTGGESPNREADFAVCFILANTIFALAGDSTITADRS